MKEKLYTMEVMEALEQDDECPCCHLERKIEQDTISFVLGASYMEDDIRAATDQAGFCRHHTKMMFDYGNSLGNAWILKTRMEYVRKQFSAQSRGRMTAPSSKGRSSFLFKRRKPGAGAGTEEKGENWMRASEHTCYVCQRFEETYGRILKTFLHLLRTEPEFLSKLLESKGFCLPHFGDLYEACERELSPQEAEKILPALHQLMEQNLNRIQADIDWFIDKFDYRNQDADWRTSKDAVQRTMQKLVGTDPADPVFKQK